MFKTYDFKVAWCPLCSQGWVEIVKDVETKELYVMCEECEDEWDHPTNVNPSKVRTEINRNRVTTPTSEEVQGIGWNKYIISR